MCTTSPRLHTHLSASTKPRLRQRPRTPPQQPQHSSPPTRPLDIFRKLFPPAPHLLEIASPGARTSPPLPSGQAADHGVRSGDASGDRLGYYSRQGGGICRRKGDFPLEPWTRPHCAIQQSNRYIWVFPNGGWLLWARNRVQMGMRPRLQATEERASRGECHQRRKTVAISQPQERSHRKTSRRTPRSCRTYQATVHRGSSQGDVACDHSLCEDSV